MVFVVRKLASKHVVGTILTPLRTVTSLNKSFIMSFTLKLEFNEARKPHDAILYCFGQIFGEPNFQVPNQVEISSMFDAKPGWCPLIMNQ